ncbi:MAG TPA: ABC transporter ATP-binding protein, partial [Chloroflexota bacterium]|nr:ABC transporter ATP-binding protein [Chloroflexota bacterium]
RPKILLLDEPSHGLSPGATAAMFSLLAALAAEEGMSLLIVEQQVRPALAIASYAYVIEAGTQALQGPPDLLIKHPRMRQAYLGGE